MVRDCVLEDRLKCQYYNEFMAENRDLYERDPTEYWAQATRYCSRKIQGYMLKSNDKTKRK